MTQYWEPSIEECLTAYKETGLEPTTGTLLAYPDHDLLESGPPRGACLLGALAVHKLGPRTASALYNDLRRSPTLLIIAALDMDLEFGRGILEGFDDPDSRPRPWESGAWNRGRKLGMEVNRVLGLDVRHT